MVSRLAAAVALVLIAGVLTGCASSAPPPGPPHAAAPIEDVRRLVVVASGESRFAVVEGSNDSARILDDVMKWLPHKTILAPIAQALHRGITWLVDTDRESRTAPRDVAPAIVVADAFAWTLLASNSFGHAIVLMDREPVGETRRKADAIIRVSVPSWGVMRVQEGKPHLVGAFADVRAAMTLRETGVVVWAHDEDVTHPERLSLEAVTADRAGTRERLIEVLERAGARLANELVYTYGAR